MSATGSCNEKSPLSEQYVARIGTLSLCPIAGFVIMDQKATEAARFNEYTAIENFVRNQIDTASYMSNGGHCE